MYSIYKISNTVTSKVYIGQTSNTIEYRFKEHLDKSNNSNVNHRPLYLAMNKYGKENFYIECLEVVSTKEEANKKEQFYIKQYDSFKNGYNATIGGDCGSSNKKQVLQIDIHTLKIVAIHESTRGAGRSINKPNAKISTCCTHLGRTAYGYYWCFTKDYDLLLKHIKNSKRYNIQQIDPKTQKVVAVFFSSTEAAKKLNLDEAHIRRACRKERKTCGGFIWNYI